jgi:hypothetical protein
MYAGSGVWMAGSVDGGEGECLILKQAAVEPCVLHRRLRSLVLRARGEGLLVDSVATR